MAGIRSLIPVWRKITELYPCNDLLSKQAEKAQRETAGVVRDTLQILQLSYWVNSARLDLCTICTSGSLWIQEIQGNKIFGSQIFPQAYSSDSLGFMHNEHSCDFYYYYYFVWSSCSQNSGTKSSLEGQKNSTIQWGFQSPVLDIQNDKLQLLSFSV